MSFEKYHQLLFKMVANLYNITDVSMIQAKEFLSFAAIEMITKYCFQKIISDVGPVMWTFDASWKE